MLKFYIIIANLFFFSNFLFGQMVLKYDIKTSPTMIDLHFDGSKDIKVDWGDGSPIQAFSTIHYTQRHTFETIGLYTVTVTGRADKFGVLTRDFRSNSLIGIESWDGLGLTSLSYAFYYEGASFSVPASLPSSITNTSNMFDHAFSFNYPIGSWNTENVTDMSHMFENAYSFNQNISTWNLGNAANLSFMFASAGAFNQPLDTWNIGRTTDVSYMFFGAKSFNQPINNWNTGNVINMSSMFWGSGFNQPLNNWNTGRVLNMSGMFKEARYFNQPIETWNTANVTDMVAMFQHAFSFNKHIDTWNTANVTDMGTMFYEAASFNQPLGNWNTAKVVNMKQMFINAYSFNQPIGSWNIGSVTDMTSMFYYDTLCSDYYDNILIGWAAQPVKSNVTFGGGGSKYSSASANARAKLISKGWRIFDGGQGVDNRKCALITDFKDLQDQPFSQRIEIYPNPSTGLITVAGQTSLGFVSIYNSVGALVYHRKSNSAQESVDLSSYKSGVYLLRINDNSTRFVKE